MEGSGKDFRAETDPDMRQTENLWAQGDKKFWNSCLTRRKRVYNILCKDIEFEEARKEWFYAECESGII